MPLRRSPVQQSKAAGSPVPTPNNTASATSLLALEQSLPPLPTHPPLPVLPTLTHDEKLELRLQKSLTYVRGLRKEDLGAAREHARQWRARVEAARFRSEPLGLDRFHRRYWILSDDFSRIWVEKSDHAQRDWVEWSCYTRLQQVDELVAALNPHGVRENALREALEVCRPELERAMNQASREREAAAGGGGSGRCLPGAVSAGDGPDGHGNGAGPDGGCVLAGAGAGVHGVSGGSGGAEGAAAAPGGDGGGSSKAGSDLRVVHGAIRAHAASFLADKWAAEVGGG